MCVCVCVSLCVCVAAGEEIDIQDALADTMSLIDWVNFFSMTTMIQIFRDFKPILDLDLYVSICLRKELQSQKLASLICRVVDLYASIYGRKHLNIYLQNG